MWKGYIIIYKHTLYFHSSYQCSSVELTSSREKVLTLVATDTTPCSDPEALNSSALKLFISCCMNPDKRYTKEEEDICCYKKTIHVLSVKFDVLLLRKKITTT